MKPLAFTLKAFPAVTVLTIGLCYLTQLVSERFGVKLPDQENIELMRKYAGLNLTFIILCAQVLFIMPAIEECIFRWLLYRLPCKILAHWHRGGVGAECTAAVAGSALFSAAHYLFQPFPDTAFIALFFFGLAQCWLYRRTGSLWCCLLNHALFNLANLTLLFVIPQ
ncbi:MAG: CPBP family intramembrane metalloprotease [Kiritimatiellae bacterium]|nr:CPBP family intramembrane metalloprotease [Kiritimatiellia bacterium]